MTNPSAPTAGTRFGGPPGRFRGPFARWPRASDAALAIAIFVVTVTFTDGPGDTVITRSPAAVPVPVLLLFAVAAGALYWRRRAPLVGLGVAVAASVATLGSDYADLGGVTILALYGVGRYATNQRRGRLSLAAALAVFVADSLIEPAPWGDIGFGVLVLVLAWYVGRRLRLRAERAAQRLRDQAAEARRIVTEERARIARELHDVVAHRVSLMTVQAGAAKAVAGQDPAAALRAMGAVEEAGRQALDELRRLLGVLRPESDQDDLGPQPGLADLSRLLAQIRAAGLDVTLTTDGLPAELPARVDLFAYRIIQEALTNVLKHAGPGTRTAVRLATDRSGVLIEVCDDGPGTADPPRPANQPADSGHGIIGMRERALLLGGRLDAGPRAGGGFRVAAHLPTEGAAG